MAATRATSAHWLAALCLFAAAATGAAAEPATIPAIRGNGGVGPLLHQRVTTAGVVTATTRDGYFLQDRSGDGDPTTPDGIFVYNRGAAPMPIVGDEVQLDAVVAAYTPAGPDTRPSVVPRTELHPLGAWRLERHGDPVKPVSLSLPSVGDDARRLNGMLVQVAGPLTIVDLQRLQVRGQLVLAAGGRLEAPTNRFPPGPVARAFAAANTARRLVVDVGLPVDTPALLQARVGDTLEGLAGVLDVDETTGGPRLRSAGPLRWAHHDPRPNKPRSLGGSLTFAAFNLDNAFTTYADGTTFDGAGGQGCRLGATRSKRHCRGPADEAEGDRQHAKLVAALAALDADAVALMEVQNDGLTTVQDLVDGLNARVDHAAPYAALPLDSAGSGSDAIQLALIYRPTRLRPIGAPMRNPDPVHLRPPLAQTFTDLRSGVVVSIVAVHFKSKRCGDARHHDQATGDDADQSDGQGCWNARRRAESQALLGFVDRVRSASGSADVLLVGDFNAYAFEDPIRLLVGAGFLDLLGRAPGVTASCASSCASSFASSFAYSYVYDGESGRLDHALASPSLARQVTGAAEWHIDADEPPFTDYHLARRQPACAACIPDLYAPTPYRASDHDPLKLGFDLRPARPTTNPP